MEAVMPEQDVNEAVATPKEEGTTSDGQNTATPSDAADDVNAGGGTSEAVPYSRFKEVIDQKNKLQSEFESKVEEAAAEQLYGLAQKYPDLAKALYGDNADNGAAGNNAQPKAPEAPASKDAGDDWTKRFSDLEAWKSSQEEHSRLMQVAERVESEMDKHDVLGNDQMRTLANNEVAIMLSQNPNLPIDRVVKQVAEGLVALKSGIEKQLFEKKKSSSAVPANGPGGNSPVVNPEKLTFQDNSTYKALQAIFEAEEQ